jgi:hypothetical protein
MSMGTLAALIGGLTQACSSEPVASKGGLLGSDGGGGQGNPDGSPGVGGASSSRLTPLGKACLKDSDCGRTGITCLTSASSALAGEGAPGGTCVADCTADGPAACAAIDSTSICIGFTSTGPSYCLQGCTIGPTAANDQKCHKRLDVACDDQNSTDGTGFCRPVCRGDFDCGSRKCDLGTGFCQDAAKLGTLAIGSACDPKAAKDPCAGVCVPVSSKAPAGPGLCEGFCSLGGVGCGVDPAYKGPGQVACLFDGTTGRGGDLGDLGLCGSLCDCDKDCNVPGRVCRPFTQATEAAGFQRAGYCASAVDQAGKALPNIPLCSGATRDASAPDARAGSGGSGGTTRVCGKGDTRACVGPRGCSGGQECLADGSGFSACDCGTAGGSGGAGGGGGAGGARSTDAGPG